MQHRGPGLGHAVGVLRHRDFTLFYGALLVAAVGGQIQTFANLLQIYDLTQSPLHLGLTGLARAIPLIGLSLVGGVIADRLDRRTLIMVAQASAGALALALAAVTASGTIAVWHIYAVTFLGSVVMAISAPARGAIIPSLVPREHLMNALALNSTTFQIANIVGPALAGIAVVASGFAATYLVNSGAHVITLLCLAVIAARPTESRRHQSALSSIKEGLAFVRHRSLILALLGMDAAAMLFGTYRVLFPVIGDRLDLDPARVGLLFSAPGIGALVGAAIVMSLGDVRYKGLLVAGAILAYCAGLVVLAVAPVFLLALLAAAALGVFDTLQSTPRNTLILATTPDEIRGRVDGFRHMLTGGMPALGQAYMGGSAAILGAPLALMVGAVACAAVVVGIVAKRPDLRAPELAMEPEPAARRSGASS